MIKETSANTLHGIGALILFLLVNIASAVGFVWALVTQTFVLAPVAVLIGFIAFICLFGVFRVQPNQAVALTLFGKYKGSTTEPGLRWANPFYSKKPVSLRVRNFDSDKLKVNDLGGSPIEIAAVVVWKVVDSAEALFAVDDFVDFVQTQSEAALRQMATSYAYDGADDDGEISLRSHTNEIAAHLQKETQERLDKAGVEVLEARISHLAYAPEIASAMLQRQQAGAIIAARQRIVEGAVSMVDSAIKKLSADGVVELDEERKAAMVSNLLVVLCGDKATQPIVNAGSLY
ncbi:MAG: SPFH domain-containing protein [Alphaproteobacteria bacterium]|nr:MAG: SPFH domain-containing protein [Alphaproteobacteria bacterium]